MKKYFSAGLLALWVGLCLTSCRTSTVEPEPTQFGYDYFPLRVGAFYHYDVFRVDFRVAGPDTASFELREVVADTLRDLTGALAYRIERFTRPTAAQSWPAQPDSVWTARRTDQQGIRTENNQPLVRLSFPVARLRQWDVHSLSALPPLVSTIATLDQPRRVADSTYARTLAVVNGGRIEGQNVLAFDSNFVNYRREIFYYAADVGLVEIDIRREDYDTQTNQTPRRILSGHIYRQTLRTHGQE